MPPQYEGMKAAFKKQGLSDKEAKTKAAKIYNSKHSNNPVTNKEDK